MADRQFVVEAIFRAIDQLSPVLSQIRGNADKLGSSIAGGSLKASAQAFDDVATRAGRLGQALASGNFTGAARELSNLADATKAAGSAVTGTSGAAEGAGAAFAGMGSGALVAAAGVTAVGIAAAVAVAKLLEAGDEGARFADQMGGLATRTGIGVESLSRLAFIAQQSDVDIQTLASGIKFLSKNLFDAKQGSGDAYDALIALGFSNREIAAGFGTTEQALTTLSARFAAIENPATRTALALRIFGRSGEAMIPFLIQSPGRVAELSKQFDQLGGTVSRAQQEIGDKYTHALEALHTAQEALKVQLSEQITPAVTDFILKMSELVGVINNAAKASRETFSFDGLVSGLKKISPLLAETARLVQLVSAFSEARQDVAGKPTATPLIADPGKIADAQIAAWTRANDEAKAAAQKALDDEKKRAEALAAALEAATKKAQALRGAFLAATSGTTNFAVSGAIANKLFELDPAAAPKLIAALQAVVEQANAEVQKVKIPVEFEAPKFDVGPLSDTKALDTITPTITEAVTAGSDLAQVFEGIGINVQILNEQLAIMGEGINSLAVLGAATGAALEDAFRLAFDPLRVSIEGVQQAVVQFADTAFASLGNLFDMVFVKGQASMLTFQHAIEGAIRAMTALAAEIAKTIIKALILRAIGFVAGGGITPSASSGASKFFGPGFTSGGSIRAMSLPGFAAGGAIASMLMTTPLYAANGLALPGGPSFRDTIPIMASAGEFVVPNFGTETGTSIMRELAGGMAALKQAVNATQSGNQVIQQAPTIGEVHIHANDSDSVRNNVRRGTFGRELDRALELGR